jgi:lysozyme
MENNIKAVLLIAAAGLLPPALLWFLDQKKQKQQAQPITSENKGGDNLKAFLLMLQYAEGTYGASAYRTLYGGDLFNDYSSHPNIKIRKGGITSTAAGAYQFLYKTWKELQQQLGLPDFSPISQDRAAIELIRRKGALEDIMAGRLSVAISKCRKTWASLPGAGYGQHEHSLNALAMVYQQKGGSIKMTV